jgi:hypothetical protein
MESNNQPKWNVCEMQRQWKSRRNQIRDHYNRKKQTLQMEVDTKKELLQMEVDTKKELLQREMEDKLAEVAREEDTYIQRYRAFCARERENIHRAYQERKEMEGRKDE